MRAPTTSRTAPPARCSASPRWRRRSRDRARCASSCCTSGVNPSDVKSRAGTTRKIAFPRVIPHSDGAGEIDRVGEGVPASRVGERVWVWNGQWRRPFGTAAESIVLPARAGRAAPRQCQHGGRRLPRHSGLHRLPGGRACRRRGRLDRPGCRPAPARSATTPSSSPRNARRPSITTVSSPAKAEIARAGRRRPHHRLPAGERRRAGHGDHRRPRRRAVIEIDLAANAQALARRARRQRHASPSTAAARPRRRSRSNSCCRTASR